jgi:hypothetical protein
MGHNIPQTGFTPDSAVSNYGDGNSRPADAGGSYYTEGAQAATLVIGAGSTWYEGCVSEVVVTKGSTTAAAIMTLTDSNDASSLTNKRYIKIGLGSAANNQTYMGAIPVHFRFREGLVVTVVDSDGESSALIMLPFVQKSPAQP